MRPSLGLTRRSSFEEAIKAGERFSVEFGLGDVPAERLAEKMEDALSILVLMVEAEEGDFRSCVSPSGVGRRAHCAS